MYSVYLCMYCMNSYDTRIKKLTFTGNTNFFKLKTLREETHFQLTSKMNLTVNCNG